MQLQTQESTSIKGFFALRFWVLSARHSVNSKAFMLSLLTIVEASCSLCSSGVC